VTGSVTTTAEGADVAEVAILGGGLAGCLTALAHAQHRPEARVVIIEEAPELAGNHTWCCFTSDVDGRIPTSADGGRALSPGPRDGRLGAGAGALIAGLVAHRWSAHRVRFPGFERNLQIPYVCLTAARLREAMASSFVAPTVRRALVSARVIGVAPHAGYSTIALADGRRVAARLVLDARGGRFGGASGDGVAPASGPGYQKFLGREVTLTGRTAEAGTEPTPLVMDATVPQEGDGFRFMYVLPLGDTGRVLLEDTSFSDGPELDLDGRRLAIDAYLRARGLRIEHVHREESGVLPMPSTNPTPSPGATPRSGSARSGLAIGYAGGLFHAGTGYSLPIAAAAAVALATAATGADPEAALRPIRERMHAQNRYFALLNRLMFAGVPPALRRGIFARFYGLPIATIARFYAARTTFADRARMLVGRPPSGFRWRSLLPASARHPDTLETGAAARSDPRDLGPRGPGDDILKEAT
jgi:lycopene beta-cyclase